MKTKLKLRDARRTHNKKGKRNQENEGTGENYTEVIAMGQEFGDSHQKLKQEYARKTDRPMFERPEVGLGRISHYVLDNSKTKNGGAYTHQGDIDAHACDRTQKS